MTALRTRAGRSAPSPACAARALGERGDDTDPTAALLAWYTSSAGVTNSTFRRVALPVLPRARSEGSP